MSSSHSSETEREEWLEDSIKRSFEARPWLGGDESSLIEVLQWQVELAELPGKSKYWNSEESGVRHLRLNEATATFCALKGRKLDYHLTSTPYGVPSDRKMRDPKLVGTGAVFEGQDEIAHRLLALFNASIVSDRLDRNSGAFAVAVAGADSDPGLLLRFGQDFEMTDDWYPKHIAFVGLAATVGGLAGTDETTAPASLLALAELLDQYSGKKTVAEVYGRSRKAAHASAQFDRTRRVELAGDFLRLGIDAIPEASTRYRAKNTTEIVRAQFDAYHRLAIELVARPALTARIGSTYIESSAERKWSSINRMIDVVTVMSNMTVTHAEVHEPLTESGADALFAMATHQRLGTSSIGNLLARGEYGITKDQETGEVRTSPLFVGQKGVESKALIEMTKRALRQRDGSGQVANDVRRLAHELPPSYVDGYAAAAIMAAGLGDSDDARRIVTDPRNGREVAAALKRLLPEIGAVEVPGFGMPSSTYGKFWAELNELVVLGATPETNVETPLPAIAGRARQRALPSSAAALSEADPIKTIEGSAFETPQAGSPARLTTPIDRDL